jgi:predicted dithiol-disulfide oxidoreductase (DUF899 family)
MSNAARVKASSVNHPVVSKILWVARRRALPAREKELSRPRDRIAIERRAMPWVRIDKDYVFDGPKASARSPICSTAAAN